MQNQNQTINGLDLNELKNIVKKVVSSDVEIIEWSYVAISDNNVNPNTAGIFRIYGIAEKQAIHRLRWSLILKVIHWVNQSGTPLQDGYNTNPDDWNYWKREALVYSSGYLDELDGNLVPAKCYAVSERVDGSYWIWLEDLQQNSSAIKNLDRFVVTARHFGQFGGNCLTKRPRAEQPMWLCKNFLRQWVRGANASNIENVIRDPNTWRDQFLKNAFPISIADHTLQLIEESETLINILDRQDMTLCHNDCDQPNLFMCHDSHGMGKTVAIDWGFFGEGAIGQDLGTQIGGNIFHLFVDPSHGDEYGHQAIEAYLSGLSETGWTGNHNSVRFACYVTASLRYITYGAFMLKCLGNPNNGGQNPFVRIKAQGSLQDTIHCWGESMYLILRWFDEARRLVDLL